MQLLPENGILTALFLGTFFCIYQAFGGNDSDWLVVLYGISVHFYIDITPALITPLGSLGTMTFMVLRSLGVKL